MIRCVTFGKIVLGLWLFAQVGKFCDQHTDKFRTARIYSDLRYDPRWATPPPPLDTLALFDQTYTYLSSGGQCWVFLSEDGETVIKLFKHHRRTLPFWMKAFPLPSSLAQRRTDTLTKREQKRERDFQSYHLCYNTLREETGMVYIHLNKTDKVIDKRLRILDKIHIAREIPLDDVEFVVQKRATLVFPHLDSLMEQGNAMGAKKAIHSLINLIIHRCQRGIFDEDARIHRNFGFIDNEAMILDVGRLRIDESRKHSQVYIRDLHKITGRLKTWLQHTHPTLVPYLDEEIERVTYEAH